MSLCRLEVTKLKIKVKPIDILIVLIIICTNIFVGSPLRYNISIANFLINIVALIYVIKTIYKKEEFKLNKIDILITILSFSTFIPLISREYLRLGDTVEYILRYISALNVYFITKKYIKENDKGLSIIANTIIIMSIILIFIGIDMMHINILGKLYDILKTPILHSDSKIRISSLFKYPNAFAVYVGVALFLSIGKFLKTENKYKKIIYVVGTLLQIYAIIQSHSRLCWGIMAILLVIYLIVNLKDVKEKFSKINKKKLVISLSTFCSIFIVALVIIYQILPNEITLFNNENKKSNYRRQNIVVEKNKTYNLKIDLESTSDVKDNFIIFAKQVDENEEKIEEEQIVFDNFKGTKQIEFTTKENVDSLSIIFKCKSPSNSTSLTIHSVYLDDKEIKMHYKLIPIDLVNRLGKLKVNSYSTSTRLEYIKHGIKKIKQNPLSGQGGNAFKHLEQNQVELRSIAEHCYPLQLFLQNGIIAFVTYVLLIISLLILSYKTIRSREKDILKISIAFSLGLIILHSLLDFDMYFQTILIEMYMLIAILNSNKKEENAKKRTSTKLTKIVPYVYTIILVIFLYFNLGETITLNWNTGKIKDNYQKLNAINIKIALSPYYYKYYEEKANCLATINRINNNTPKIEKEVIKCIRFITDIEKDKSSNWYHRIIVNKIDIITEENQDEILKEINEIWENEIGANDKNIYDNITKRLKKNLDNKKTEEFIKELKIISNN